MMDRGMDDLDRAELMDLQKQMNQTTDQTLESTRRMLQLAEESQDVGVKTLGMLDEQGEKLDRVDTGMDQINEDMKEAERHLTGLEKCCGCCVCPCGKAANFEAKTDYGDTWNAQKGRGVHSHQPSPGGAAGGPGMSAGQAGIGGGSMITRITNDAREDEMDSNLQDVSGMLGNLKHMAIDMGTEIGTQNKQIDQINLKAKSNQARIAEADRRAQRLLK